MGCNDETRTFEAPNEAAAIHRAKMLMADARHEDGNDSYAGHIGICDGVSVHRTPKPLSMREAEELTFGSEDCTDPDAGLAKKYGPAILLRVRNTGSRKAKWVLAGRAPS